MNAKLNEVTLAIAALSITNAYEVYQHSLAAGLISKGMGPENPESGNFFGKSFGANARKAHLKNWAPGYTAATFAEVGVAYHEYKAWKAYNDPVSYSLLGMAVLTGREPGMPNGVYTKCGKSFAKHLDTPWAKWFYENELTVSTVPVTPIGDATTEVAPAASDLTAEYTVEINETATEVAALEQLPEPPAEIIVDMSSLDDVEVAEVVELVVEEPAAKTPKRKRGKKAA